MYFDKRFYLFSFRITKKGFIKGKLDRDLFAALLSWIKVHRGKRVGEGNDRIPGWEKEACDMGFMNCQVIFLH